MDPLTQGVLGAVAAQIRCPKKHLAKAAIIGALAGMSPDLDVLIHSSSDSLLSLEYHRQFTHSLIFIPFGALLCAAVFYGLLAKKWQLQFRQLYVWCLLGFATHGLLDACTSYGTQLLWPFSHVRISWDIISIIDPLFTVPLLALVVFSSRAKQLKWTVAARCWVCVYLSVGVVQHERALDLGYQLAAEQGDQPLRLEAKPSFANILVWKVIYETDTQFHVSAVKPGFQQSRMWSGDRVNKLDLDRDLPWLDKSSQQAKDIQRFDWFSAGFVALDQDDLTRVVDIRYSFLPHKINPMWGIKLSKRADREDHVEFYNKRVAGPSQPSFTDIWGMLWE